MSKPCSNWLTFAGVKQSAYKSGRPELLQKVEMFRKLAQDDGIEKLFEEVLKVSEALEKSCRTYSSNGY